MTVTPPLDTHQLGVGRFRQDLSALPTVGWIVPDSGVQSACVAIRTALRGCPLLGGLSPAGTVSFEQWSEHHHLNQASALAVICLVVDPPHYVFGRSTLVTPEWSNWTRGLEVFRISERAGFPALPSSPRLWPAARYFL